jgi:hypothetical protein
MTDKDGSATIDWIPNGVRAEFIARDPQEYYGAVGIGNFVQLPRLVRLEGSVRLADGTPVPWARLAFGTPGLGSGETNADAGGNFSFFRNPHDTISVVVESNLGATPAAAHVNTGDGSNPPRIDFVLEQGARFFGTVLAGADRKPYRTNVRITEMVSDYSSLPNTTSADDEYEWRQAPTRTISVDENGNFETRLPPGKFEVRTWLPRTPDGRHGDDLFPPIEFEIADESEKRLDFYFPDHQRENAVINLELATVPPIIATTQSSALDSRATSRLPAALGEAVKSARTESTQITGRFVQESGEPISEVSVIIEQEIRISDPPSSIRGVFHIWRDDEGNFPFLPVEGKKQHSSFGTKILFSKRF